MLLKCPVCRRPISWKHRVLRNPFGAKWECPECRSLLGLKGKRPVEAGIVLTCIGFGAYEILGVGKYGAIVAIPIVGGLCTAVLLAFERVVCYEARQAHCPCCGYDLRGVLGTRCPECREPTGAD